MCLFTWPKVDEVNSQGSAHTLGQAAVSEGDEGAVQHLIKDERLLGGVFPQSPSGTYPEGANVGTDFFFFFDK